MQSAIRENGGVRLVGGVTVQCLHLFRLLPSCKLAGGCKVKEKNKMEGPEVNVYP